MAIRNKSKRKIKTRDPLSGKLKPLKRNRKSTPKDKHRKRKDSRAFRAKRDALRFPKQLSIPVQPEAETMTEVEFETERKLSTKIIVGKRLNKIEKSTDLYTVIGIATGTKTGQSGYGDWLGLVGQFEAVRCDDGRVLRAPVVILPDEVMEALQGESAEETTFPWEFALTVAVDPSTNNQGFEYRVKMCIHARRNDPLAVLRAHIRSAQGDRAPASASAVE